jgi:hypothetical protein
VNFHITRIRLASVGPEPARYDPLDLNFMNADGTGPADTVLYLQNAGGKTVLLRLIFSALHPPAVDRIGKEETARRGKNLAGYVLERDTAHIVVEWRRAEKGRFIDEEVLVTGLVAEWRAGRPPNTPSDLDRLWYTLRGPATIVGADRLNFHIEEPSEGGPVRRRIRKQVFEQRLAELAASPRRGAPEFTKAEKERPWVEHLEALGLDHALFRYQGEMNHNEAGASAIARFTKDLDFIAFFLDAVMDPGELSALDREFDEVSEKVRRFPEYERRIRFEEAALVELEPLAALVVAAATARDEAAAARRDALAQLSAFAGGEAAARERERTQRARFHTCDAEARRLTAVADRWRDESRELRRIAAAMYVQETEIAFETSARRAAEAELDVRGWSITEDVVRVNEATAEVRVLDAQYEAELHRLRPLQLRRDEAARALARRLAADAVLAAVEEHAQRERARSAKTRASNERDAERQALMEATKIDTERVANERSLVKVLEYRERLVAEGYLETTERADTARDRERDRTTTADIRSKQIETEVRTLDAERVRLDEIERAVGPRRDEVQQHHARADSDAEQASTERAQLVVEPFVIELAESEAFELELVGPAIAERLLGRANQADADRVDLELRGRADQRALRGLDAHGLLPPSPDVETTLARLGTAGIRGAIPGTHYVAEAIAAPRRFDVAARHADLVGGIVLTDPADLARARAILDASPLEPSSIIAIGPASELVDAEKETNGHATFVVPPAAGVWDRSAAVTERARREARLATLESERGALDATASGARLLANALARHAAKYPAGWLAARRAERDALAGELERLDEEADARVHRRTEIASTIQNLRDEMTALHQTTREAERRATALDRLARDEVETADLPGTIERQRADAADWRAVATESAAAAALADEETASCLQNASDQRAAVLRIRGELATMALADPVHDPTREEAEDLHASGDDLLELRARFNELDQRLTREASESEIAIRRDHAIRTRDSLQTHIEAHPAPWRERAAALLARPEAGDFAGRRAAATRADAELVSARDAEREAHTRREQARKELGSIDEEIKTSRRTIRIADERMPQNRHDALRLAAETRQQADATQRQVTAFDQERAEAKEAADDAKRLADALLGLANQLRMLLNVSADGRLPDAAPYAGDVETAQRVGLDMSQRLTGAIQADDRAEKAWRARVAEVRMLLAREEFADLAASDRLHRRLAQSTDETLAHDAKDLVDQLRSSIGILRDDLATMAADVKLVTTSLAKSVNKALSYLRLAETRSKMPETLRGWAGQPFLTIRFDKPLVEELEARLTTFVAGVVNRPTNRPTGSALLLEGLERAVGAFGVQILKPNEAFAPIRVPVAELSSQTFSNGQRSTVATALMLMLSELRRQSRATARGASVGTFVLDNPFGNANAGFLIEVQRTIAAAAGIQLIYTTGIGDLNALRHFPNLIALSNDAARGTMRRYVRAHRELLDLLTRHEGGPGGRLSATRVNVNPNREADVRR